ncbi:MAG: hypothetical protein AAFU85_22780 [Planctomycetota bacterium]
MPNSTVHCPLCAAPVSARTIEKFDGACRRCAKQPIQLRQQWIFFGAVALLVPAAAFVIDQEFAELERSGGELRIHTFLAIGYQLGGRVGLASLFAAFSLLLAVTAYRSFLKSKAIGEQLAELKRRPIRRDN